MKFWLLLVFIGLSTSYFAQRLATLEVTLPHATNKQSAASPVLLLTYRYGGFGWRATEKWNKDNSEVLTSGGKTRPEADGSTARWCIVPGQLDNDYGGAVLLSSPTNYNHPEPLRVWPETQNGRGDVFVTYSPTKNKDWLQRPGQTYTLRYRLLVFNGRYTKE